MRRFKMPPAEYPEPFQPDSIVHGLDYMLHEDGRRLEFYYNYLDYIWRVDATEIRARHYLEKPEPSRVAVMIPMAEFDRPEYSGILTYLQRRYLMIDTFEREGGYTTRWIAGDFSAEAEVGQIAEEVRRIVLEDWDPLGVKGRDADRYYGQLYRHLAMQAFAGETVEQIADGLLLTERGSMNLVGNPERAKKVAQKIWNIVHC